MAVVCGLDLGDIPHSLQFNILPFYHFVGGLCSLKLLPGHSFFIQTTQQCHGSKIKGSIFFGAENISLKVRSPRDSLNAGKFDNCLLKIMFSDTYKERNSVV